MLHKPNYAGVESPQPYFLDKYDFSRNFRNGIVFNALILIINLFFVWAYILIFQNCSLIPI